NRMLSRIKERYHWKNMRSDIEDYVKNCKLCQSNKALRKINKSPMQITTSSTRPFERISLDLVGPLPEAGLSKIKFILTLQDDLTTFSIAYPISNATAEESCECLVHFISLFGIPKSILTDQGTNFTAELFKVTCQFLKIKQLWSSPYHPQTQGA
ncbi:DDE-type integrase/transposase/recombinase, partial [Pseudomonas aeruginosa]